MTRILAIETSCDETASALLEDAKKVLSNVVASQEVHSKFGGVVPELASRSHLENINFIIKKALDEAKIKIEDIDAIAFTSSPGLIGSLLIGQITAETISYIFGKKIIPVNHLEGHIYSSMIENKLIPPFLSLTVSGGHTDLVFVKDYGKYEILGRTRDDAAGEAFDKVAKLLNLKYPGGPEIEKNAKKGNPSAIDFPRPYMHDTWDFSFSGLKTAVLYYLKRIIKDHIPHPMVCDICASFQEAVIDTLVEKVSRAMKKFQISKLSLGGGVVSNARLRKKFKTMAKKERRKVYLPSSRYCTDNAAMIACAAYYKWKYAKPRTLDDLSVSSESKLISWRFE